MGEDFRWWERGVIYQVYPRSFQDSNGDGIGDLAGITRRLDHLVWLGVDAVWISPFYPSPMVDFGYDITDYTGVDPRFGTLEDFDRLVEAAHAKGLRVLLDFVPNHTSDRHPWFLESRAARESPRRDWYIWRDPGPDGGPPNNWRSVFGGSAWEADPATGQYYYHAFLREQPDLNWLNPAVRSAMHEVLRFWLRRGVDGFRVDVIWHLVKDPALRNNPPNPRYRPTLAPYYEHLNVYSSDRPEVHEIIAGMREVLEEFGERLLVGEIYLPVERLVLYYGTGGRGAHLPFNFQLIELPWDARTIGDAVAAYEAALPPNGWPNWVLGNHDKPRIASRVGAAQARVAAMLLLTLRGTPTIYYGDELGLANVPIPPELVQDPYERNVPGLGVGRDPERTPMPWDGGPAGGFTSGTPWLPLGDQATTRHVAAQREDPHSMLSLYRRLLLLRRAEPALAVGRWRPVAQEPEHLAWDRAHDGRRLRIHLNFGRTPLDLGPAQGAERGRVLLSTHLDRDDRIDDRLRLRPDEGVVTLPDPGD